MSQVGAIGPEGPHRSRYLRRKAAQVSTLSEVASDPKLTSRLIAAIGADPAVQAELPAQGVQLNLRRWHDDGFFGYSGGWDRVVMARTGPEVERHRYSWNAWTHVFLVNDFPDLQSDSVRRLAPRDVRKGGDALSLRSVLNALPPAAREAALSRLETLGFDALAVGARQLER